MPNKKPVKRTTKKPARTPAKPRAAAKKPLRKPAPKPAPKPVRKPLPAPKAQPAPVKAVVLKKPLPPPALKVPPPPKPKPIPIPDIAAAEAKEIAARRAAARKVAKALNIDKRRVRTRLEDEALSLEKRLKDIAMKATGGAVMDVSDEGGGDDYPVDLASEVVEREKSRAVENTLVMRLRQIRVALETLADGTYGVCDECGQAISRPRLDALPYATLCVECQSLLEHG